MKFYSFDDLGVSSELGVTPGGAQDISYLRDQLRLGVFPAASTFTPEGLFSEHDLPLKASAACDALLCVRGEAVKTHLVVQPDVQMLAQLGFSSGIDAGTFRRAPINLVAVVDISGSMSGQPLDLVKRSLSYLISNTLRKDDQLSIVVYGNRSRVLVKPTRVVDKTRLLRTVAQIESDGATNMEEGLRVGYRVAHETRKAFEGTTRVMLFTDEQPNVGSTDAQSFMGMAREAATHHVGMTTIGIGVAFGAEFAEKISSVRGGNLFFFPEAEAMAKVFREDFEMMVTDLAHDLQVDLRPARGWRIAGVYGVPGKMLTWSPEGDVSFGVETLFASRKKGAIYVSLAPRGGVPVRSVSGERVLTARIAYTPRVGEFAQERMRDSVLMESVKLGSESAGLRRGAFLVNEAVGLNKASTLFHDGRTREAMSVVRALLSVMDRDKDETLAQERTMVRALLSGLETAQRELEAPSTQRMRDRDDTSMGKRPASMQNVSK